MFFFIADDTYMYDDAVRRPMRQHQMGHWYDEPPYESDPDDFLMSVGPAATIQVCLIRILFYFVWFSCNLEHVSQFRGSDFIHWHFFSSIK